jgi:transcription termination factor Rho
VLDVLPNGSGFVRVDAAGQSRDDVYVSPAQIRRCELRAGDELSGPLRPARRNERHPSLVRVESVNGGPAEPPEERPLFADMTAIFATARLSGPSALSSVPFGRGSRVAIGGPPGAGATTLLQETIATLASSHDDLELAVVLVGVRPEEVTGWSRAVDAPVTGGSFDRSTEAQVQAAELAVERAKRVAERGRDAVIVLDSLEALPPGAARRIFGAARNTEEAGSLTVIAATGTASEPQRWATTRIVLEPAAAGGGARVDAAHSSTLQGELLG